MRRHLLIGLIGLLIAGCLSCGLFYRGYGEELASGQASPSPGPSLVSMPEAEETCLEEVTLTDMEEEVEANQEESDSTHDEMANEGNALNATRPNPEAQTVGSSLLRSNLPPISLGTTSSPLSTVPAKPKDWQVIASLYAWLVATEGNLVDKGMEVSTRKTFTENLSYFRGGGMARLEAWKKDWGLITDIQGVRGVAKETLEEGISKTTINRMRVDMAVSRRFRIPMSKAPKHQRGELFVDPILGVRNSIFWQEVELPDLPDSRLVKHWLDPYVGLHLRAPVSSRAKFYILGDVGGFGIGNAAHFTWDVQAALTYQVKHCQDMEVGYRLYDVNYDKGGFALNVFNHGPFLAYTWYF